MSSSGMERLWTPESRPTTAPSSPPDITLQEQEQEQEQDFDPELGTIEERALYEEEQKAQVENNRAEERRRKLQAKKKRIVHETKFEREAKAKQLEELLKKSAAFSDILTKKTQVLGRVGSGFDGKTLGEHDLVMAEQPKCMVGGTMRDYQLEGLTWMFEICSQGMSGILADEMGLGKTIQTISLIALLREKEGYLGPHLIVAPLSTLSNWIEEFQKWVPDIPVLLYHGPPPHRRELVKTQITKNIVKGRVTKNFPVVCTTPEIVLRDQNDLSKTNWEFIIIDEGHRLKNSESKLFAALRTFTSATRLLITGTPLQNNLKELWSLLNFLLPNIFTDWGQFESWFDFSDLQDQEGTEEFLQDKMKQDLVKKMHLILQPLLLRRVKADVEHMLPKKREYVLYAPMTKEQTDLYNVISTKGVDTRKYLEERVVERLTQASKPVTQRGKSASTAKSKTPSPKKEDSDSEEEIPLRQVALRTKAATEINKSIQPKNAFQTMMQRSSSGGAKTKAGMKRKSAEHLPTPKSKSAKSSRSSTPASSIRGRKRKGRKSYAEADASDEDALSDDEFEQKLAEEMADNDKKDELDDSNPEEAEHARMLEQARKEVANKKLGNPIMQLRLVCNSPLNFHSPWATENDIPLNETLVTSSGKMLLLDRLLPTLFKKGHKVLIFSQFKTQLDILSDYFLLRSWKYCRIDGSVSQEERRLQIKEFNENASCRLFILSTRAGGQGINLASADTVILFDSDWNPQQDLQAQDRAHRIGQTRPVIVYRLATKGTVEEDLLLGAEAKRRLEKLVIKKGGFRSMGQKMDVGDDGDASGMGEDALKSLLLKDGMVYKYEGGEEILSGADLDVLCDRSPEAYDRAERGEGDKDGWKVVETKLGGLMSGMGGGKERK